MGSNSQPSAKENFHLITSKVRLLTDSSVLRDSQLLGEALPNILEDGAEITFVRTRPSPEQQDPFTNGESAHVRGGQRAGNRPSAPADGGSAGTAAVPATPSGPNQQKPADAG